MKDKIENPKVFISYAWGSDEYQSKVLAFASQLVGDGVDVVLDKWNLTEGNDTFAFMETCVTDPSITNVLMLLDPIYAKKADEHTGGVGAETQIISAKVYKEVTQDKFIPIVMERDENGEVCKPTYLQGRLHFDLSLADDYDNTYQRLVKSLYGEEVYVKPKLGKKPSWVEQPVSVSPKSITTYDSLKKQQTQDIKSAAFIEYLRNITGRIADFSNRNTEYGIEGERYIELYNSTEPIKTDFLLLLRNSIYVDESKKTIASFFEETVNSLPTTGGCGREIAVVLIHELFIYTVAFFVGKKDYSSTGYILSKTYFSSGYYSNCNSLGAASFDIFYSASERSNLDNAVSELDGQKYYSGTAKHWTANINTEFCTKEQFVLADLICYNYSVYGKHYISNWPWFPITYIYENRYNSALKIIAQKLASRENLQEVIALFGYENVDDFIVKFKSFEENPSNVRRNYRYPEAFESAHLIGDFIKAEQLGCLP